MWFEDWSRLGVLLLAGASSYAALLVVLRVSGKRTLAKLNAFDFVVTIALGSVLATTILSRDIPVIEGIAALTFLVAAQFVVALASVRWPSVRGLLTAQPAALLVDGELQQATMRRCRITSAEVRAAVRQHGAGSLARVDAVVLETDGSLSVIADRADGSALDGVGGWDTPAGRDDGRT